MRTVRPLPLYVDGVIDALSNMNTIEPLHRSSTLDIRDLHNVSVCTPSPAFRSLYEQQRALVRRTVRRFRVAHDDIDDVVQEVFVILHLRLDRLSEHSALEPWLRVTARRVSSNWRRWHRRHQPARVDSLTEVEDLVADQLSPQAPDEAVVEAELRGRLLVALGRIDPKRRTVLAMSLFEQLTLSQIAARLGTPLYTVASRLRVGHQELVDDLARNR